ncbi:MAG TPA: hypothetical protein VNK91_13435 [Burkholderiaceae bacterium]|jgi:hypothetical protein|nr:hypothetical protein [Burkholderiaceae bacterium]
MTPAERTAEMAVWSEERWAAFETDLQRELRLERQRLQRKLRAASPRRRAIGPTLAAGALALGLLVALFA